MKNQFRPVSEMTVTSLADVAIILLVIFMVAGISASLTRADISVNLPRTSAAKPNLTTGVVVSITKVQEIYIDRRLINTNEFNGALNKALSDKGTNQVFLQADVAVPYGIVIEIVSKIKEAGVENLGLVAEPKLPTR